MEIVGKFMESISQEIRELRKKIVRQSNPLIKSI